MAEPKLAVIDVKPGAALESQSGLQMMRPRIYGAYIEPPKKRTAAIVMHPASNFMGHYLIEPLAERGICCLGLNSRYAGNDTLLLMERVIQDLGAGVKFLRTLGYERMFLVGNSGGASLSAFYQAQAEHLTAHAFVDADPRCLDLSLDPNDRALGSVWGDARTVNYAPSQMGCQTSLTAFLSQWSSHSRADGPANLARTSVPALLLTYTADQSTFPSKRRRWLEAGGERIRNVDIAGGDHYLAGQPGLVARVADHIAEWAQNL